MAGWRVWVRSRVRDPTPRMQAYSPETADKMRLESSDPLPLRAHTMRIRDVRAPLTGFVAMGVFWGAWGTLVPDIRAATGASDAALGAALLCVAVGAIPSMIAGGRLVDRFGVRALLPLSVAAFGLSAVLPAAAPNPVVLGAALLVVGMASGFMDVVMNAGVAQAEAETGRRSMQFAHGSFAVTYVAAALLSGQARGAGYGPLPVLAVVAVSCLVLAVLARRWAPEAAPATAAKERQRPDLILIGLGVIGGIAFLSENGLQSWSALFLERLLSAPPQISSLAPATVGLAVAVGRFGGQVLAERISDKAMLFGGACLGLVGSLVFATATTVASALAGIFVAAGGVSVLAPAALGLAGRSVPPDQRGSAVATVGVIAYGGFFVGPAMLGFLSDGFGLRTAMASLAACALLAVAVGLAIAPRLGPGRRPGATG